MTVQPSREGFATIASIAESTDNGLRRRFPVRDRIRCAVEDRRRAEHRRELVLRSAP